MQIYVKDSSNSKTQKLGVKNLPYPVMAIIVHGSTDQWFNVNGGMDIEKQLLFLGWVYLFCIKVVFISNACRCGSDIEIF